jgi:hypothetical protein
MSIRLGLNISVSPRSLFAAFTAPAIAKLLFSNDEPGVFYDFDDWSTLFQDTAGTQPVTAANQGVALALDKRLGLELGPELVTNGTFETDLSGWFIGANVTAVQDNGEALVTFAGTLAQTNNNWFSQLVFPTDDTKSYQIEFDATWVSGGSLEVGTGFNVRRTIAPSTQKTRYKIIARRGEISGDAFRNNFTFGASSGTVWRIDNVTVRELKGNHATQATTAARPLTVIHPDGGVRNLLDRTEEFDNAVWEKQGLGAGTAPVVTSNAALAPDGTMTAERVVFTLPSGATVSDISQLVQSFTFGDANYAGSFYIKSNTGADQNIVLLIRNIQVATVTATTEWQRVSASLLASAVASNFGLRARGTFTAGTVDLLVWGAQLELGSTATPYQKRVNFLEVTEAGKRSIRRLYFNGTSHFMTTPTITPNTDKAQVFAGVRKLSDAAIGFILELSDNINNNLGSIAIWNGGLTAGAPQYSIGSRGSSPVRGATSLSSFAAPTSNVLTGLGDISGDLAALRIDGAQVAQNTADQGTGNYLAYPAYIGARGGTSIFFNGYIDQLITRFGANLDSGAIGTTEKYVSTKSPELVAASEVTWNAGTDTYIQNLTGLGR